jgi:hypothetical protein
MGSEGGSQHEGVAVIQDPLARAEIDREVARLGCDPKDEYLFVEGVPNSAADLVPRANKTWSDTNIDNANFDGVFDRLVCRNCGGASFEVLKTGDYETTARCPCGFYYKVHCG